MSLSERRRWFLVVATIAAVAALFPRTGEPHIVQEEPWHPVPAAYLRSLFYMRLEPVDWRLVDREYQVVEDKRFTLESVYEGLEPARTIDGFDHVNAVRVAIEAEDSRQLYSASTRALAQLTRHYIGEAGGNLGRPGAALEALLDARRIFRAFEPFIRQTDRGAFKDLGLAWLEMSTGVGSSGILAIGGKSPGPVRFLAAGKRIEDYLQANYEVDRFTPRASLDPVPDGVVASSTYSSVAPWLPPGSDLNEQDPLPRLVLNFEARGIDERELFLVAYGDMLFDSPAIFGDPARSLGLACSSCHNRSDINRRFFIPGISHQPGAVDVDGEFFNPRFNDHRADPLDIPSLRGIRFTAPYGRDGRFGSLREFSRNVIVNEFAGDEPTPLMLDALVTYMLEFDWLPSPYLNPDGTLNTKAPPAARRGQELFTRKFEVMGNRACSTCHLPSANFIDGLRHDIGSGEPASEGARDSFFDTPTLINAKTTAPYFHDGSLETLADVVEWFDERFGLRLTATQRADLTAYVEAVGTGASPFEIFDDDNTRFQLDWQELSAFLSTLDTLLVSRDKFHADLLLATVAADLRLDASGLKDLGQAPQVYELADKL
ncbi:MAG: cytochrome c peroxidase, partial [Acidobacteriota bacterium]